MRGDFVLLWFCGGGGLHNRYPYPSYRGLLCLASPVLFLKDFFFLADKVNDFLYFDLLSSPPQPWIYH